MTVPRSNTGIKRNVRKKKDHRKLQRYLKGGTALTKGHFAISLKLLTVLSKTIPGLIYTHGNSRKIEELLTFLTQLLLKTMW